MIFLLGCGSYDVEVVSEKEVKVGAEPFNQEQYNRRINENSNIDQDGANNLSESEDEGDHIFIGTLHSQQDHPLSPVRSESPTESVSSSITLPSDWTQHNPL